MKLNILPNSFETINKELEIHILGGIGWYVMSWLGCFSSVYDLANLLNIPFREMINLLKKYGARAVANKKFLETWDEKEHDFLFFETEEDIREFINSKELTFYLNKIEPSIWDSKGNLIKIGCMKYRFRVIEKDKHYHVYYFHYYNNYDNDFYNIPHEYFLKIIEKYGAKILDNSEDYYFENEETYMTFLNSTELESVKLLNKLIGE